MKKIYFLILATAFILLPYFVSAQGENCNNPIQVSAGTNSFTGVQNTDQWFNFTATQTGKITISCCGLTPEDTYVKIYSGGFCIPLTLITESDDHCSTQSKVSFIGTFDIAGDFGYDYFIVWQNKSSSTSFDWTIIEESWGQGETCNDPLMTVVGSTNQCDHGSATDQWFSYTAPGNGTIKLSTCGLTTENTSVRVYDDCSGIQLDGNDDFCSTQSEVEFTCVENTSYLIQWERKAIFGTYNWSLTYDAPTSIEEAKHDYRVKVKKDLNVIELELSKNVSARITIHSMLGNVVKSDIRNGGLVQLDCSSLASGIYIVSVSSEIGVWNEKIYWK